MSQEDDGEWPPFDNTDRVREKRRKLYEHFTWQQLRKREWIAFREIVEWFEEFHSHGMPDEAASNRCYDLLMRDLLLGDFEECGRAQVRYLHYITPMPRTTRQRLINAIKTFPANTVRSQFLAPCWIPRHMFDRWLAKHGLLPSPARFISTLPHVRPAMVQPEPIQSAPAQPEPTRLDQGEPPPSSGKRRGPRPRKLQFVIAAMRHDVETRRYTVASLNARTEAEMSADYEASRETIRKARTALLTELQGNSEKTPTISDKTPTNDN
jgi:hypothetical protein